MPLLKYTTTVPVNRTVSAMMEMLAEHGAEGVRISYKDRRPRGISFAIQTPFGRQAFTLPVNVDSVSQVLAQQEQEIRKLSRTKVTPEQAERVAWRIAHDWLAAQLAIIEAAMATLDQIMLPYLQTDRHGGTLYQSMVEKRVALPPAREDGSDE